MKVKLKNNGSVMLITIFVIALLSAVVMGMAQMNIEEIQLMRNQVFAAEALTTAEAGLNDALYEIRADPNWADGFTDKSFNGGSYDVTVTGSLPNLTIESEGTSSQSFVAKVQADITVGVKPSDSNSNVIRIDNLRINE